MRDIHVFENSYGLFQAGENFDRSWGKYQKVKGNFLDLKSAKVGTYGESGLSIGGGHQIPGDFLGDFIRNYCNCPKAD
jgi:hypothetical protein